MKVKPFKRYHQAIEEKLSLAFQQEKEIQTAAQWIADCVQSEGWIYTSGTGHSHMMAEEIFYRAGGFARVRPILSPPLMLHEDASGSTEIERKEGYAEKLFEGYVLEEKDVFLISSNSGRNPVSIEMAQLAQKSGAKVITITNLTHSRSVNSRHSSGQKLFQVSDVFLDNFGEIGDASIDFEGFPTKVGATSTVVGAALLQGILVQAVGILLEKGIRPEIFNSSNSDKGEEENELLIRKYKSKVKGL